MVEVLASENVDDNLSFITLFVKTAGDGGSGTLVDDTKDLETGDGTGVLGGLKLSAKHELSTSGDESSTTGQGTENVDDEGIESVGEGGENATVTMVYG